MKKVIYVLISLTLPCIIFASQTSESTVPPIISAEVVEERPSHDPALFSSIQDQNIDAVRVLAANSVDVNIADGDGFTPLYIAAETGNLEIVQTLVDAGANVNLPSKYQLTPLMAASAGGHLSVVKYFIMQLADVNAIDAIGKTALHHAAYGGDVDTINALLAAGALKNPADQHLQTPLLDAIVAKSDANAYALLIKGANYKIVNAYGYSAYDLALENLGNKSKTFKFLSARVKPSSAPGAATAVYKTSAVGSAPAAQQTANAAAKNAAQKNAVSNAGAISSSAGGIAVPVTYINTKNTAYVDNINTQNLPRYKEGMIVERVVPVTTSNKK